MQRHDLQHKTPAELQELCNFLNWLHRRVWLSLAAVLAVCALIWNPYHLATAALFVLVSRAEWDARDLKALD